jgi:hypothetical protein
MTQRNVWGAFQRCIQVVLPRKLDHGKVDVGDREKGNRVLKQWAGAVGIVAGAICLHWRTSGSLKALGPIILWTGGLVLILFDIYSSDGTGTLETHFLRVEGELALLLI